MFKSILIGCDDPDIIFYKAKIFSHDFQRLIDIDWYMASSSSYQ